ncbi:hypothetical protein VHEMI05259 [[Torrubiella] hemipterigena]|uniref:Uncharacterized protein n=1 Tax=[Torrubiella] hemipterigena TaxID=1531966 RepID=A0A0A1SXG6_9HYPO|nr:hypothetical protein VHEMI05259 [[Torrubiella] hemipterigena]
MTNFGDLKKYGLPARKPWDGNIKTKVVTLIPDQFAIPEDKDEWTLEKLEQVCVYIGIDWKKRSRPLVITSVFDDFVRACRLWTYQDITLFNKLSDKLRLGCNRPTIPNHPIRRQHWGRNIEIVHAFLLMRLFGCPPSSRYMREAASCIRRIPARWHRQNREARELMRTTTSINNELDHDQDEQVVYEPASERIQPIQKTPIEGQTYHFKEIFDELAKGMAPELIRQGYSQDYVVAVITNEVCNWIAMEERRQCHEKFQRLLSSMQTFHDDFHAVTGMQIQMNTDGSGIGNEEEKPPPAEQISEDEAPPLD